MTMKTLLIIGSDKIGLSALRLVEVSDYVRVVFDQSSSLKRILNLIIRKRISLWLVVKMALAEIFRKSEYKDKSIPSISSNRDLQAILNSQKFDQIILFRAGLIIESSIIDKDIPIYNIHAATIPEYGGLGSIYRAISDNELDQRACLHSVTNKIDEGTVIDFENYKLSKESSYSENENVAYQAAITLLQRTLTNSLGYKSRC